MRLRRKPGREALCGNGRKTAAAKCGAVEDLKTEGAVRKSKRKKRNRYAALEAVLLCIFALGGALTGILIPAGCFPAGIDENQIHPITREAGSGTRDSFRESFGIEKITDTAEVTNSTAVVLASVVADPGAIGYAALPSVLHSAENLRLLRIDGAEASLRSVEEGRYPVTRTIFAVTCGKPTEKEEAFLRFALSAEGARAIREAGCVPFEEALPETEMSGPDAGDSGGGKSHAFQPGIENSGAGKSHAGQTDIGSSGAGNSHAFQPDAARDAASTSARAEKLILAGSSSAVPVFSALKEAYEEVCERSGKALPGRIEIQQSDSAQALTALRQGICDIGMTSRRLTEGEKGCGLREYPVARDAIVLIVHPKNPLKELSTEEVRKIYEGERTEWSEIT